MVARGMKSGMIKEWQKQDGWWTNKYRFPGFRPKAEIKGIFGDPKARVIQLERRQKKVSAAAVERYAGFSTIARYAGFRIYHAGKREFIWMWKCDGLCVPSAGK